MLGAMKGGRRAGQTIDRSEREGPRDVEHRRRHGLLNREREAGPALPWPGAGCQVLHQSSFSFFQTALDSILDAAVARESDPSFGCCPEPTQTSAAVVMRLTSPTWPTDRLSLSLFLSGICIGREDSEGRNGNSRRCPPTEIRMREGPKEG